MSIKSRIKRCFSGVLSKARLHWKHRFAADRNEEKQRKQTHLWQVRRGIRPPNTLAFRIRIFKARYNISL